MKYFAARNLVEQSVKECLPWEFQTTEVLSEQIRHDKTTRQAWYQNVDTNHCFYTAVEGINPNARVSRDNPAIALHAITADYDLRIPEERLTTLLPALPIQPTWIERSLGGNLRLIFEFPRPIVGPEEFLSFYKKEAVKWLGLHLMPGLDEGATASLTRLLCNGCVWRKHGGPISEPEWQAFYVKCAKDFRFDSKAEITVPLDHVEAALRAQFPGFTWPGEFLIGTQGPTFWVPESTSPLSAIVKQDGMFTFSAHADKCFYSWTDLLGKDFVKDYETNAIAKATQDIFWDGKNFWRKIKGVYTAIAKDELLNYFEVSCGLSNEGGKGKRSMIKEALEHIYNEARVHNAAPYVFRPPGRIMYQGRVRLNTYVHKMVQPAAGPVTWGPQGEFPFLSRFYDGFMEAIPLAHYNAWLKYFLLCGLNFNPQPGQMVIIMGDVGCGKTLNAREIVGRSVGGFADAEQYIVGGTEFNEHFYECPLWCMDDDTISDSLREHSEVQARFKKIVANKDFYCNQKFRVAGMTEWTGRMMMSTNLDFMSTRILGTLDNGTRDKISLFRCLPASFVFPDRVELIKIIQRELPYYIRYIIDHEPPDFVIRDTRFGFAAYQDASLMDQAHQTSRFAPFKELLIEMLLQFFDAHPKATEWRGTLTQLQRMLAMSGMNDSIIRSLRLEQTNRYLEGIQREGVIPCRVEPGQWKQRLWVFDRFSPATPAPETPSIPSSENSDFSK